MSSGERALVITYTLNRDEDPLLFDHLAAFKKGRHRRARLGKLIGLGFEYEKAELRARDGSSAAARASTTQEAVAPNLLDDLIGDGLHEAAH